AQVVDVEDEQRDAAQHLGGRPPGRAVETPDRHAGGDVTAVGDVGVGGAPEPVLRGEDRGQPDAGRAEEQVDVAAPAHVHAGVVGHQADRVPGERREV